MRLGPACVCVCVREKVCVYVCVCVPNDGTLLGSERSR